MSDDILDRIDSVLGHDETVIDADWAVSGDAMRSRPPVDGDEPYEPQLNAGVADGGMGGSGWTTRFVHIYDAAAPTAGELSEDLEELVVYQAGVSDHGGYYSITPEPSRARRLLDLIVNRLPFLHRTPQPPTRVSFHSSAPAARVRVTLLAETSAFVASIRHGMAGISAAGGVSAREAAANFARLGRLINAQQREMRAREEMRAEGRAQLQAAQLWFDQHVDGVYADLGLERGDS